VWATADLNYTHECIGAREPGLGKSVFRSNSHQGNGSQGRARHSVMYCEDVVHNLQFLLHDTQPAAFLDNFTQHPNSAAAAHRATNANRSGQLPHRPMATTGSHRCRKVVF
jgi:hypothetical protein